MLKTLLPSDPRNPALLRRCAQLAVEVGEYGEALDLASAVLTIAPGDAEAMFHRASALMGLRHFKEAAACLAVLRAHGIENPGVLTNLAMCHYMSGEFAEARALLDVLMAADEINADVLRLAVSSRHHLGELDAAVALADAHGGAAQNDSALAGVYALAYLDAGRSADASTLANQVLEKHSESIDALTVAGTIALSNMDNEAADAHFRRVLALSPENGRALIGLGAMALIANDMPLARERLERGVRAMSGHVGSWHILGWTQLLSRDYDAAERTFSHALSLDRNFAETHGALAAIHVLRGRTEQARQEIALAERLDRESLAASFAKALLRGQGGDAEGSLAIIRSGIARLIPRVSSRAAKVLAAAARPPHRTRH